MSTESVMLDQHSTRRISNAESTCMPLRVNPDLLRLPSGTEQMVVHEGRDEVHRLSRVAGEILDLADGSSPDAIVGELIQRYPSTARDVLARDVDRILNELSTKGLVVCSESQQPSPDLAPE